MCKFFSFAVTKNGEILHFLGEERRNIVQEGGNPDSHSYICDYFRVNEDETWKFDLNFCPNSLRDFQNMSIKELKEFVESVYDGGLPFSEFPLSFLVKVVEFLDSHRNEILELGQELFGVDYIMALIDELQPTEENPVIHRLIATKGIAVEEFRKELFRKRFLKSGNRLYYLNAPTGMKTCWYVAVSSYIHKYLDAEGQIQTEIRYNIQLHSLPV